MLGVPAQGAITPDNVTLTVDAVVYFRVIDPVKALVNVTDYPNAVSQVSQTSLRAVIGRVDLDTLLSDREQINDQLKSVIDGPTEEPWGLRIERVEVKDFALPETMKRSMSRQAEAERERRARVIAADGKFQASQKLSEAAGGDGRHRALCICGCCRQWLTWRRRRQHSGHAFPGRAVGLLDVVTKRRPPRCHGRNPNAAQTPGAPKGTVV